MYKLRLNPSVVTAVALIKLLLEVLAFLCQLPNLVLKLCDLI